jgi:mRNA interferase MazF
MAKAPTASRGEIWMVDFDPAIGAEIQKLRPALVVSVDTVGQLPLRMVVPITDWKPQYAQYPWFVELPADASNGLAKDSGADAFQTKSVSLARFVHQLGMVTASQLDEVASAIALCVGALSVRGAAQQGAAPNFPGRRDFPKPRLSRAAPSRVPRHVRQSPPRPPRGDVGRSLRGGAPGRCRR